MSNTDYEDEVASQAYPKGQVIAAVLASLVSLFPLYLAFVSSLKLPSAGFAPFIVVGALGLVLVRLGVDKFYYIDDPEDASKLSVVAKSAVYIWSILAVVFAVGAFRFPPAGFVAFGSAAAALATVFFVIEGRMRIALWAVCCSALAVFSLPVWQSLMDYAVPLTAWSASNILDMSSVPNLYKGSMIDTGRQSFDVLSLFASWYGIETYMAICLACGILFRRPLVSLLASLALAFYWGIAILSCEAAIQGMKLDGIEYVWGMGTSTASWLLFAFGLVGVIAIEQFIAAFCVPLHFNTLDTPLPVIPQVLNRLISFPNRVMRRYQVSSSSVSSKPEIEYEEISLSALTQSSLKEDAELGVVRFEEVLQRQHVAAVEEREQA
jgi:hypothetical protein